LIVVPVFAAILIAAVIFAASTAIIPAAPSAAPTLFALIVRGILTIGLALFITLGPRLFLTGFVIGDHSEIVIRKLQVILGLNSVAMMLSVLRKFLIFIKQLRRIAARAAVNPVERVVIISTA
jgi:hypothetical protein